MSTQAVMAYARIAILLGLVLDCGSALTTSQQPLTSPGQPGPSDGQSKIATEPGQLSAPPIDGATEVVTSAKALGTNMTRAYATRDRPTTPRMPSTLPSHVMNGSEIHQSPTFAPETADSFEADIFESARTGKHVTASQSTEPTITSRQITSRHGPTATTDAGNDTAILQNRKGGTEKPRDSELTTPLSMVQAKPCGNTTAKASTNDTTNDDPLNCGSAELQNATEDSYANGTNNTTAEHCNMFGIVSYLIKSETCDLFNKIIWHVVVVVGTTSIAVGSVGNILAFSVLTRSNMRRYSTSLYSAALAVSDTLFLSTGIPQVYFIWTGGGMALHDVLDGKLFHFFYYSCSYISVWLVIAMSVDRLIVVFFPFKARQWCNSRRTKMTIAGIFIFFSCLFIYLLIFTVRSDADTYVVYAVFGNEQVNFYHYGIQPWVDVTFYLCLPFMILTVTNSLVTVQITALSKRALRKFDTCAGPEMQGGNGAISGSGSGSGSAASKVGIPRAEIQMTIMANVVCLTFLILTLPLTLTTLMVSGIFTELSPEPAIYWSVSHGICGVLPFVNSAINFILYCMTGMKFRRELQQMFTGCCGRESSLTSSEISVFTVVSQIQNK